MALLLNIEKHIAKAEPQKTRKVPKFFYITENVENEIKGILPEK